MPRKSLKRPAAHAADEQHAEAAELAQSVRKRGRRAKLAPGPLPLQAVVKEEPMDEKREEVKEEDQEEAADEEDLYRAAEVDVGLAEGIECEREGHEVVQPAPEGEAETRSLFGGLAMLAADVARAIG